MYNQFKEMLISAFGALLKIFVGGLEEKSTKSCSQPQMSFLLKSFSSKHWPYAIDIHFLPKTKSKDITGKETHVSIAHYQGVLDEQTSFTFPIPCATEESAPYGIGDHFRLTLDIKYPSKDKTAKPEAIANAVVEWIYLKDGLTLLSFRSLGKDVCYFKECEVTPTNLSLYLSDTNKTEN
jgi:hypothetical protein